MGLIELLDLISGKSLQGGVNIALVPAWSGRRPAPRVYPPLL